MYCEYTYIDPFVYKGYFSYCLFYYWGSMDNTFSFFKVVLLIRCLVFTENIVVDIVSFLKYTYLKKSSNKVLNESSALFSFITCSW